jgi:hypothetical protein
MSASSNSSNIIPTMLSVGTSQPIRPVSISGQVRSPQPIPQIRPVSISGQVRSPQPIPQIRPVSISDQVRSPQPIPQIRPVSISDQVRSPQPIPQVRSPQPIPQVRSPQPTMLSSKVQPLASFLGQLIIKQSQTSPEVKSTQSITSQFKPPQPSYPIVPVVKSQHPVIPIPQTSTYPLRPVINAHVTRLFEEDKEEEDYENLKNFLVNDAREDDSDEDIGQPEYEFLREFIITEFFDGTDQFHNIDKMIEYIIQQVKKEPNEYKGLEDVLIDAIRVVAFPTSFPVESKVTHPSVIFDMVQELLKDGIDLSHHDLQNFKIDDE